MNSIRAIAFDRESDSIQKDIPSDNWKNHLNGNQFTIWVDLCGDQLEEFDRIFRETFQFHPLAIKDALIDSHVPRIDDWQDYIYLTLHCTAIKGGNSEDILIPELDVFIGNNYLVTFHKDALPEIDSLFSECERDAHFIEKGPAGLFYHLADHMVNNYILAIKHIGEKIDQVESEIFNHAKNEILGNIFSLKRTILQLRGVFLPQREVFNKLARGDFKIIPETERIYFRDIYDHMAWLEELNENLRDLVSGATDTYLSVINNRMNDVMKTLTMITTLFMPLAFITSFFGMSFFQPTVTRENWTGSIAFVLVLIILTLTPFLLLRWMRTKDRM